MEYYYEFNHEKNKKLLEERGISFEQIISLIEQGHIIETIEHTNKKKYANQKIYVIDVDNYCYLVPHVINDKEIFLKTIIPSRKATKDYMSKNGDKK